MSRRLTQLRRQTEVPPSTLAAVVDCGLGQNGRGNPARGVLRLINGIAQHAASQGKDTDQYERTASGRRVLQGQFPQ